MPRSTARTFIAQEERFRQCHSFEHEWRHGTMFGIDESPEGWSRPFGGIHGMIGFPATCQMCGTEKVRWVSRSGESHNRYHYPDGYQQRSADGEAALTRTEFRRVYVSDLFAAFDQPRTRRRKSA
jgi:hypothetical protein